MSIEHTDNQMFAYAKAQDKVMLSCLYKYVYSLHSETLVICGTGGR